MVNEPCRQKLVFGLFFLSLCWINSSVWAQGQNPLIDNQWYFGNTSEALIFDKTNLPDVEVNIVNNQATPFGLGGSAVAADEATGDLIFYSDGANLYDASHSSMLDAGVILNGNPNLNNAAVASPAPDTPASYYLFTNSGVTGVNEVQYTIVNSQLQGNATNPGQPPLGDVTTMINQSTGLVNPSDAMVVVPGLGNAYWLINQDVASGQFRVMTIDAGNFGAIQTFNFFNASIPPFEVASFAYNEDSTLLAVSPKEQNRNIIILDFDPSSGNLSFNTQILNSGNTDDGGVAVADVAWSASGTKLFFSRRGSANGAPSTGQVYQFGFDTISVTSAVIPYTVFRSFGLKRGPDSRIYHLYQLTETSPVELGRFNFPDSLLENTEYDSLPLGNSTLNGIQFPEFAPPSNDPFDFVDFNITDSVSCVNNQVFFTPVVNPTPQTVTWDFGDGGGSGSFSPIYGYEAAYAGPVTMTVSLNGRFRSVQKNVTINMNSLIADLGNDTTICVGEELILDPFADAETPPPAGTTFSWNTGETSPTIMANSDTTRTYWVYVESPDGCSSFDEIIVTVYGDQTQVLNYWYFGQNAGINFTPQATALDDGEMIAPENCSTVSDRNGNLLFYTNGSTIYNRDHEVMVNGTDIGGDSTVSNGAMIVPVSSVTAAGEQSATIFYVFTADQVYGDYTYDMTYSIVDIRLDSARGEVLIKDQPLFRNSTERMTASGFGNGTTWMVGHEYGNNTFRAYQVGNQGVATPTITSEGSQHFYDDERKGRGYMKLANGELLGVALPGEDNFLEIFEFDSIGRVRNGITIDIEESAPSVIYGVEFSSDGRKVYVTTNNGNSKLIQYSLDSLGTEDQEVDIQATKNVVYAGGEELGAIQTGPDRQVYVAVEGLQSLGIINGPTADNPTFSPTAFPLLAGTSSLLGLPNFVQIVSNPPQSPGISFANTCFGQPVEFFGSGTSDIDEYDWIFGDDPTASFPGSPDTLMVQNPIRPYEDFGEYTVQLRVYNRCGYDSVFVDTLEIFTIPDTVMLESPQNICEQDFLELAAFPTDTSIYSYTWSTGDTARVIQVSEATSVSVFITNSDGCSSPPATINVADQRPDIELGPPLDACQNEELADIDGSNGLGGLSYTWEIDGEVVGTDRFQSIETEAPGLFSYKLRAFDPILKCAATDSVAITVLDEPTVSAIETFNSSCGINNGRLLFELAGDGNFTYAVTGPVNVTPRTFTGINPVTIDSLGAGIYTLFVTNTVSGCTNMQNINIEDIASFDIITTQSGICGLDIALNGNVADTVLLTLLDESGQVVTSSDGVTYDGSFPILSSDFITSAFNVGVTDGGSYNISVREAGAPGCVQTDSLTLIPLEVTIAAEPNCNVNGLIQLTAEASITEDVTFQWQDANGNVISGESTAFLDVTETGTYIVNVTDVNGNCSSSDFIDVLVVPIPEEDLLLDSQALICSLDPDPERGTIELDPGIFDTYEWRQDGVEGVLSTERMLLVSEAGAFVVQLFNGSTCVNDRIIIEDDCRPTVVAPNAFTPNQDGTNDTFSVFPNDYVTEYAIFIFDRWGEMVFQSDDQDFQWDGVYRGQLLPTGTYAYKMVFRSSLDATQSVIEQYGGVTLLK